MITFNFNWTYVLWPFSCASIGNGAVICAMFLDQLLERETDAVDQMGVAARFFHYQHIK